MRRKEGPWHRLHLHARPVYFQGEWMTLRSGGELVSSRVEGRIVWEELAPLGEDQTRIIAQVEVICVPCISTFPMQKRARFRYGGYRICMAYLANPVLVRLSPTYPPNPRHVGGNSMQKLETKEDGVARHILTIYDRPPHYVCLSNTRSCQVKD
ncbi:hypothetical protein VNO77_02405 [Canavalia gladiata]|uniref:Uncharacterized protein n=1 Tax=Canavalia gladiata TaxID=3824 RepID=A0AAN9MY86_CANGL